MPTEPSGPGMDEAVEAAYQHRSCQAAVFGVPSEALRDHARYLVEAAYPMIAAAVRADERARVWDLAMATVERQTDLTELVHFERPSDFRKGVLSSLVALDEARKEAEK